ncbi:hypothetical protein B0I28_102531 [Glycomyces artemisiae]|uniref:Uncharacterized protein n=2 Tax=Glycomyces artemisiae TaxID=1076443 RepID=A0A2T0USM9_9ACTN|nr:hypothetical protein [Glycomyces artemisiae]PRY60916.1 hypothetical protein B0I28_102531 [Glycomyces artemisiae]
MESMSAVAFAALVVGFVVFRQLRARPFRPVAALITPAVFGLLGIAGLAFGVASVVKVHPLTVLSIVLLAASFVAAVVLGALRAGTVRLWRDGSGRLLRKGTAFTTGCWVLSFGVHWAFGLWIDHADGTGLLGTASLYAYIAFGLSAQALLLRRRAPALEALGSFRSA